jgi:hypothetical protein
MADFEIIVVGAGELSRDVTSNTSCLANMCARLVRSRGSCEVPTTTSEL